MSILKPTDEAELAAAIKTLTPDDVAIFGDWRVVIASDGGYWLAGRGSVFSIAQRKPLAQIKRKIPEAFKGATR